MHRRRSIHPSDIRHIHASRIFHAIRLKPNLSQREIAALAGTDKSTVSAVIRDFEAAGLIERGARKAGKGAAERDAAGKETGGRPGRPGERIAISARSGLLAGIHLRPQGLRCVLAGLDGEPLADATRPLPSRPADLGAVVAEAIAALAASVGDGYGALRAVGVAAPGLVGQDDVLRQSPNLGWADVPLREVIAPHLGPPVYIDNNANAGALAEFFFGAGIGRGDFAYVESGSGVGAGLFLDGSLYRGVGGFAGEFGHTKVVPQGRPCRCGALGCLSAYASNYSILERLRQRGAPAQGAGEVLVRAEAGDAAVLAVLDEAGRHLGTGLANLVNLLDLPLFVLGGGLAEFHPFLRAGLEAALADAALPAAAAGCRIEPTRLGPGDRPLGGIALALEGCTSHRETDAAPWGPTPWRSAA